MGNNITLTRAGKSGLQQTTSQTHPAAGTLHSYRKSQTGKYANEKARVKKIAHL